MRISRKYRFHKLKLAFMWSCMREYKNELDVAGFHVEYHDIHAQKEWSDVLKNESEIHTFSFADKAPRLHFQTLQRQLKFQHVIHESPMFLTPNSDIAIFQSTKPLRFQHFYIWQRKRMNILMENGKPLHGKWSFDAENRKKIPKDLKLPKEPAAQTSPIIDSAIKDVEKYFPDNPGSLEHFWLPTTRNHARKWFHAFLESKLVQFGPYEDAFSETSPFLFHSAISPMLNIGLLTPKEVIEDTLSFWQDHSRELPYSSVEGFVRQIIGWREYMKIIYELSPSEKEPNFWKHHRPLPASWYTGSTNIPPIDAVIQKVLTYGYAHHIERLMVLSNYALLHQFAPKAVLRWFMEMFVDAYEWVMYGNVYSMGLYADGGAFTTKPYISSSNYIRSMSQYKKDTWSDEWDAAFWKFLETHASFFSKQPRLHMLLQLFRRKKGNHET